MTTMVYAKLALVAAISGGTFTAGRIVAAQLQPMTAASARYCVASLAILGLVWLRQRRLRPLTRGECLATMALGATGILIYTVGFFTALRELPAGRASLIVALNPIVTLLGSILFLGERLTVTRATGVALGFVGAAIVVSRGDLSSMATGGLGAAEFAMFVAVCGWAAYTLIGRVVMATVSPLDAAAYATLWGTAFLLLATVLSGERLPVSLPGPDVASSLLFLGVLGTAIAFTWYYDGVKAIGASQAAVFTNLVPVFGVAEAAMILGEPVLPSMIVGGAVTILGVALANLQMRTAENH